MHGYGVYSWADGRKYTGDFVDDLKDGEGILEWPDGRKYTGSWSKNKQHGSGTYIKDGKSKNGIWVDGKRKEWVKE